MNTFVQAWHWYERLIYATTRDLFGVAIDPLTATAALIALAGTVLVIRVITSHK